MLRTLASSRALLLLCVPIAIVTAHADIRLPAVFADGMVLQAGQTNALWGRAEPLETIEVHFGETTTTTSADRDGRWRATLPALPVSNTPRKLQFKGTVSPVVTVQNVLMGEVWLCSGPSNLFWPVSKCDNAEVEMASADYPAIRFFTVEKAAKDTPQEDCAGAWTVCSPETVGPMSGIAYFFSRRVHQVTGAPIGVLQSFWGGSRMEAWTSQEALEHAPGVRPVLDAWAAETASYASGTTTATYEADVQSWESAAAEARRSGLKPPAKPSAPRDPAQSQHRPACLYNGMIAPLIPFGLRGVLIYQGLGNLARGEQNAVLLQTQIQDWRARWGLGPLPFGLVQPAPYDTQAWPRDREDAYALSREAQQVVAAELPNIGIALTLDVDATGALHFTNKQIVAARLANWALSTVYQHPEPYLGPVFDRAVVEGARVRIHFKHAGEGLRTNDGKPPAHFTLAGSDGTFHSAKASVDGATVLVQCDQVPEPRALRFAWGDTDIVNLVNSDGLPATLFQAVLEGDSP